MVEIVAPTLELAAAVAADLRPDDAAEVLASGGYSPAEAVLAGVESPGEAWIALFDGEVAAAFGVALSGPPHNLAVPWLLTTTVCDRKRRTFLRACRREIRKMRERWPYLVNYVHARHASAIPFARRLGFEIGPAVQWGLAGDVFHRIELGHV